MKQELCKYQDLVDLDLVAEEAISDQPTFHGVVSLATDNQSAPQLKSPIKFEIINDNASIANGDCLEMMSSIPSDSVDLIITDPPYNLGLFMKKRGTNLKKLRDNHFIGSGWDDLEYDSWIKLMERFIEESHRVLKRGGSMIVFMSIIKLEPIIKIAQNNRLYYKTVGIWHKTNPMPRNMNLHFVNSTEAWLYFVNEKKTGTFNNNGSLIHDFIETPTITKKEHDLAKHPTQKPVALISHFVKLLSNPNEVVLDPFMGSGSTGVASICNGRKFIGIELSSDYFQISKVRLLNQR